MGILGRLGEALAAAALVAGGVLAVLAGLGLLRLPDVTARLQAATKPQVVGLALICAGAAPRVGGAESLAFVVVVLFQLVIAPVLAQLVGRSAYRSGTSHRALLTDEFRDRPGGPEGGAERSPR